MKRLITTDRVGSPMKLRHRIARIACLHPLLLLRHLLIAVPTAAFPDDAEAGFKIVDLSLVHARDGVTPAGDIRVVFVALLRRLLCRGRVFGGRVFLFGGVSFNMRLICRLVMLWRLLLSLQPLLCGCGPTGLGTVGFVWLGILIFDLFANCCVCVCTAGRSRVPAQLRMHGWRVKLLAGLGLPRLRLQPRFLLCVFLLCSSGLRDCSCYSRSGLRLRSVFQLYFQIQALQVLALLFRATCT